MIPFPASIPVSGVRRPPPAGPGDRVGVAALSGPVDAERLERGVAALAALGFVPVLADNLHDRDASGLFAGDDARRLAAFHRLAGDRSLAAIFFARGGWGALRLLPAIDWELLARCPRAYVGYSDLTPFLLQVVARLGVAAIHGPMVAGDLARGLAADEERSLLAALAGWETFELPVSSAGPSDDAVEAVQGPLLGGCLSLLTAVLGTPWAVSAAGAVLFVEDIGEPLYRLDRMLTHLDLSGSLTGVRALIFGHLGGEDTTQNPSDPSTPPGWLRPLVANLGGRGGPVAWGLAAGHAAPNHALPLGLAARLEPSAGRLTVGIAPERG